MPDSLSVTVWVGAASASGSVDGSDSEVYCVVA